MKDELLAALSSTSPTEANFAEKRGLLLSTKSFVDECQPSALTDDRIQPNQITDMANYSNYFPLGQTHSEV